MTLFHGFLELKALLHAIRSCRAPVLPGFQGGSASAGRVPPLPKRRYSPQRRRPHCWRIRWFFLHLVRDHGSLNDSLIQFTMVGIAACDSVMPGPGFTRIPGRKCLSGPCSTSPEKEVFTSTSSSSLLKNTMILPAPGQGPWQPKRLLNTVHNACPTTLRNDFYVSDCTGDTIPQFNTIFEKTRKTGLFDHILRCGENHGVTGVFDFKSHRQYLILQQSKVHFPCTTTNTGNITTLG